MHPPMNMLPEAMGRQTPLRPASAGVQAIVAASFSPSDAAAGSGTPVDHLDNTTT